MEEENYFFKLSAFEDRLLEWYEAHPDAVRPPYQAQRGARFIKGGLRDISITRTSLQLGGAGALGRRPRLLRLVRRADQLPHRHRLRRWTTSASPPWWPAVHHLIGKEILRFHCVWWPAMCMAAGIDPPAHVFVHGWLLVGGEKLSKTLVRAPGAGSDGPLKLTEIAPDALTDDFGVDPIRYHLLRETPLGTDGDFSYEGIVARYNADLANNLGNLVARVATVVGSKCGGIGPGPDPQSPLAAAAAESLAGGRRRLGPVRPPRGPRGDLAAHRRGQRRARGHRALEGRARVRRSTRCSAAPSRSLRIVALLIVPAMPATAEEIWRRIGLDGSPADRRLPTDGRWGGYPGGVRVEKGAPLFPRRRD